MKTIETKGVVNSEGILTVKIPFSIDPGNHQVVVIIDEQLVRVEKKESLKFSAYPVGLISNNVTFRREDLYDDN